ncbi:MAG: ABC transporter substrate-binding protein, partial [Actinobacteria bacterium]|nr:ABC transporter substrate-binding protein [Actinomycetota bacterium]
TGALAKYLNPDADTSTTDAAVSALTSSLPAGLTVLDPAPAEDNDSINVTKATAQKYQLTSVADLAAHAGDLTLGAPPEFKLRPQGIPGLERTYGVTFGTFRPLKGAALVNALKNGQVDAANIFSTDPAIAANDFVTLTDDKRLFGAQNIVPLVRADAATPEVSAALDAVNAKLTTATLSDLLKKTDIDKQDPATVAKEFLTANGLG